MRLINLKECTKEEFWNFVNNYPIALERHIITTCEPFIVIFFDPVICSQTNNAYDAKVASYTPTQEGYFHVEENDWMIPDFSSDELFEFLSHYYDVDKMKYKYRRKDFERRRKEKLKFITCTSSDIMVIKEDLTKRGILKQVIDLEHPSRCFMYFDESKENTDHKFDNLIAFYGVKDEKPYNFHMSLEYAKDYCRRNNKKSILTLESQIEGKSSFDFYYLQYDPNDDK